MQAKSGTGKTLVFAVIALDLVHLDVAKPQAVICCPTHEIATQINNCVRQIGVVYAKQHRLTTM